MTKTFRLIGLAMIAAPSFIFAEHFDSAKLTIRLIDPDSIIVEFYADHDDIYNTVYIFPYLDNSQTQIQSFERRIEAYLQARLPVQVDSKNIGLHVVQWKPGGRGRADELDSASLRATNLTITLGGVLPKQRKFLKLEGDVWVERQDKEAETIFDVSLLWHDTLLDEHWINAEQPITYPVSEDSLMVMLSHARKRIKEAH